ncbi:hypothetical protein ACV22V_32330, partial [Burkholderia sp. AW33-5]
FALAYRWVLAETEDAFTAAVVNRHVRLMGIPPHITYISESCPRRRFVLLHIQTHPELIDPEFG